ncbi:hypothetical protein [Glycomyces sp. MUSA5-2]|uniref:hypothetical protein n=1 Tax=Glycomyces sp. MUSA5-2 TaxID=2053002 RepID=UPI003009AE49
MPVVEELVPIRPVYVRHRASAGGTGPERDAPSEEPRLPRPGTAIYHCYRYERRADPVPTYVDGHVAQALPAEARIWRLTPWNRYERGAEFDAPAAVRWVASELQRAVGNLHETDPALTAWVGAFAAECTAALDTSEGAFQTSVELRDGNMIALAVVGLWEPDVFHPRLLGGWS